MRRRLSRGLQARSARAWARVLWLIGFAAWPMAAQAAPADYRVEAVAPIVERGVGVPLKVRISSRASNLPTPGVDVGDAWVDRSPDGQTGGRLPAFFTPSLEYGIYNFRADLPTDGTWALTFIARIPGESQAVPASVTFKVVGRLVTPPAGGSAPTQPRRR